MENLEEKYEVLLKESTENDEIIGLFLGGSRAKQYGISLGIPEYQVDFAPDDEIWER